MHTFRRALAAIALFAGIIPAIAQAPPPVPGLPDAERRTTYNLNASTCDCSVGFQLYGDSTDFTNWIEVWVNGVQQLGGWTITSPTGDLDMIPRPIGDAILSFNDPQTGVVQIVGARRPRRTSQFTENRGVPARDMNQALSEIEAQQREEWDLRNRLLRSQPGAMLGTLPLPPACAGAFIAFDASGLNPVCTTISPSPYPIGQSSATTVYAAPFLGNKHCDGSTDVLPELQAFLNQAAGNGSTGNPVVADMRGLGSCYVSSAIPLTFKYSTANVPVSYHILAHGTSIKTDPAQSVSGFYITRNPIATYGDEQTRVTLEGLTINHRNNPSATSGIEYDIPHVTLLRNIVFAGADSGTVRGNYIGIYAHQQVRTNPGYGPYWGRIIGNIVKGTSPDPSVIGFCFNLEGAANGTNLVDNVCNEANIGILLSNPCIDVMDDNCSYLANSVTVTGNSFEGMHSILKISQTNPVALGHNSSALEGWHIYGNRIEAVDGAAFDLSQANITSNYPSILGPNTMIGVTQYIVAPTPSVAIDIREGGARQVTFTPGALLAGTVTTLGTVALPPLPAGAMFCRAMALGNISGTIPTCDITDRTATLKLANPTGATITLGGTKFRVEPVYAYD